MRLDPRKLDRLIHAARRFERIEQRFGEFHAALDGFKDPPCPLRQVTVGQGSDSRCVISSFGTTKVALRLLLVLPEDAFGRPGDRKVGIPGRSEAGVC